MNLSQIPRERSSAILVLGWVCTGLAGTLAAWLTVRSLDWPLFHDSAPMHYIAARSLEGGVPYRDLFDFNFPGIYAIHMLGLALLGPSDGAYRALDLTVLVAITVGLAVATRPYGRLAMVCGMVMFWLFHVSGGAERTMQRDFVVCLPLAWTSVAMLGYVRAPRTWPIVGAGLGLGAAIWVKPLAALFVTLALAVAWPGMRGQRVRHLLAFAGGLIVPALPILAWLGWAGGLSAFVDIVQNYVPIYGRSGRRPFHSLVLLNPRRYAALRLWAAGGALVLWLVSRDYPRLAWLGGGALLGTLAIVLQGKGFYYHIYPMALFAVMLGAAGTAAAIAQRRRGAALALLALLFLSGATLGIIGLRNPDAESIERTLSRIEALTRTLSPVVAANGTVQLFERADVGTTALYRLRGRLATRFLYDVFYDEPESDYTQGLRRELMTALTASPPGAIVVVEIPASGVWPAVEYARIDSFPELAGWLSAHYRLAEEGDRFRVYLPRSPT